MSKVLFLLAARIPQAAFGDRKDAGEAIRLAQPRYRAHLLSLPITFIVLLIGAQRRLSFLKS
jgi:hypothetical protein